MNLHNKSFAIAECITTIRSQRWKKNEAIQNSCIFITEGDSASGSITKSRDVNTQAVLVFVVNRWIAMVWQRRSFTKTKSSTCCKRRWTSDGIEGLRYNKVIAATDADVDGMHIRLLLITFFFAVFPWFDKGHVYILQTPLFRVRNKRNSVLLFRWRKIGSHSTTWCESWNYPIQRVGWNFDEFKHFIGKDMRLDQVRLKKRRCCAGFIVLYMGKNTSERQNFIIDNLVIEEDV